MSYDLIMPFFPDEIRELLVDPTISDLMINGTTGVYADKGGVVQNIPLSTPYTNERLTAAIERVARVLGQDLTSQNPILNTRLPDGSRVAVVGPPASINGPTLTIRKFNKWFTSYELVASGSLPSVVRDRVVELIMSRKNGIIAGGTGSGKTQLIMQILRQIRDRGDVAIVYDPACEFVQRFYDEKRGDFILNPLDARCPYWSPSSEMARNQEAAAIAASLYQPTSSSGKDEFFYRTPSKIFAHLLKQGPDPHNLAEWMADEPKLQQMVKGTEMAFFIDRKAGPQAAGVLASLGLVAESFRMLPRKENTSRTWNALDWSEKRKGWIFITSQLNEREILRPLVSLWIDTLIMRLLAVPKPGQKQAWFVIDELASLQKLPQLHTAITESRKSKNPIVLGFQGKAQLEDIYGRLAEVMLSQPATKVFMKTTEPRAAEWISETIGKVEIERLKETKFDGSRSGRNFTIDRQVESLVMASEISGLDDRHAYLKLGNNVARFDFDYIDLLGETEAFIPRVSEDDELQFARTRMGTVDPTPETPEVLDEEDEELETEEEEFDEEGDVHSISRGCDESRMAS